MKRVLVVAPSRRTRGGITALVRLCERCSYWTKWNCVWVESHVDGTIQSKLGCFAIAYYRFLTLLPSANLVHLHLSEPVSALRKAWFLVAARSAGRRVILHVHSFSPETSLDGRYGWVYRWLFRRADRVIVLSESWRKRVSGMIKDDGRVVTIYNACERFPRTLYVRPRLPTVLFAGTLNKRKGFADLLLAFARIADSFPAWTVTFAGNGEIAKGKELADTLGLADRTRFVGWVAGQEKDRVFAEASLFCLPSHAEGFPMALLDALSHGLPVVTTAVGGIPDLLVDGRDALICRAGDIESLADSLGRLIGDASLRRYMSKRSQDLANSLFSLETMDRELDRLYKEVVGDERVDEGSERRNSGIAVR